MVGVTVKEADTGSRFGASLSSLDGTPASLLVGAELGLSTESNVGFTVMDGALDLSARTGGSLLVGVLVGTEVGQSVGAPVEIVAGLNDGAPVTTELGSEVDAAVAST